MGRPDVGSSPEGLAELVCSFRSPPDTDPHLTSPDGKHPTAPMTSAVKSFLLVLLALPLLIFLGSEIGSDEYALPLTIICLIVSALLFALLFRAQRIETLLTSFLLIGYLVANRGFAQLYVVQPLFVGELCLALIICTTGIRVVLTREFLLPYHPLTWLVGAYLVLAFARSYFDVSTYGFDALRDLAIVYYALFFFLAYQIGRREHETEFIDRALKWTFILLTFVSVVYLVKGEWLEGITVRGAPLLIQKGDLTATFSAIGIFFLSLHPEMIRSVLLRRAIIATLLTCLALIIERAALVALIFAFIIPWVARYRGFRIYPIVFGLVALISLMSISLLPSDNAAAKIQDQVLSMTDFSGSYTYQTSFGDMKAADNDFRRVLWKSFYDQTVQSNQWVFGKGFGYDFIPQFEVEYQRGRWEGLRSAHNYYISVFGRLGITGFLLMLGITWYIVRGGLQAALAYRRGELEGTRVMVYWCGVWTILASGTFGVVMEGPMGAIPFWTFLGLALGADPRIRSYSDRVKAADPLPIGPAYKEEPVAVPFRASR